MNDTKFTVGLDPIWELAKSKNTEKMFADAPDWKEFKEPKDLRDYLPGFYGDDNAIKEAIARILRGSDTGMEIKRMTQPTPPSPEPSTKYWTPEYRGTASLRPIQESSIVFTRKWNDGTETVILRGGDVFLRLSE